MNIKTVEDQPVLINFQELLNDRSWELNGTKAIHYPCNNNTPLKLLTYPFDEDTNYTISFRIIAASNSPSLSLGFDTPLFTYTTVQDVTVEISTTEANQKLTFWGTGYLEIEVLNIQKEGEEVSTGSKFNVIWSEDRNRWVDFRSYRPENGFSMFTDLFTWKNGQLWIHKNNSNYNNFYGEQFQTTVKFPMGSGYVKTWSSVAIHSNIIMATTTDGITTQLGHVSDLIEADFTSKEGIHYAEFLRDKITGLVDGDRLKGRYLSMELTTIDGSQALQLFKIVTKGNVSTVNE
jgi:hypothetical protein